MGFFSRWRQANSLIKSVKRHFAPIELSKVVVAERKFPSRMCADLHRALEGLFRDDIKGATFFGLLEGRYGQGLSLSSLMAGTGEMQPAAPHYEEIDVGEAAPVRCLQSGLWLAERKAVKFAMLAVKGDDRFRDGTIHVQLALSGDAGMSIVDEIFDRLEKGVRESRSYRGKILSLENPSPFTGQAQGIKVHKLHAVSRDDVILPRPTLELLERNVLKFVQRRERLGAFGQSRKKGLLFYGPPGTGKTHTIHYLAGALQGHTTLLIAAEQVGQLEDYMNLARLLQPSMVIIEDADLIARERTQMQSVCEEVLLNKLLNEMDGLKEDSDVLFVLTTNRPEALEAALTARPGRIDQAIEFPLPDEPGRKKLIELYGRGAVIPPDVLQEMVKRTTGVSAAFIKELMRRAVQFHLEKKEDGEIDLPDVNEALEEMIFRGGALNAKLLGGVAITN